MVWVEGRRVYVNTQGTQTVKICTPQNIRGQYEKYYRIRRLNALSQQEMELRVQRFSSLVDLEHWLRTDRKAYREPQNEVSAAGGGPAVSISEDEEVDWEDEVEDLEDSPSREIPEPEVGGAVAEVLDLLSSARYTPDDDPWLPKGKDLVEKAIDQLVQEFIHFPYLHRVEHSIHAELFRLMMSAPELAQRVALGNTMAKTQLVHKEWPESVAREGNRRGNFDLAVLTPELLKGCPSLSAFREGRLHAPIVIEMGLDYDAEHLAGDAKKMINSKPKHAYLVHLVRELPREPVAEQIVLGIEEKSGIKTAYAWVAGGQCIVKLVNDKTLTEK
jgi:hypothetical protein